MEAVHCQTLVIVPTICMYFPSLSHSSSLLPSSSSSLSSFLPFPHSFTLSLLPSFPPSFLSLFSTFEHVHCSTVYLPPFLPPATFPCSSIDRHQGNTLCYPNQPRCIAFLHASMACVPTPHVHVQTTPYYILHVSRISSAGSLSDVVSGILQEERSCGVGVGGPYCMG